ncbi:hypothetical protein [Hymenobacter negativus]|uniref:Uncharacterized protein n=1 Tax=Hymenobacter negativus TaxID=2795026 RepID=A0ABS3QH54_9BACT|nr:hypothetical protein [Hymenobacter negativus]MBO2010308.1 hypothetical protein [Hymenobacter negativus]
MNSVERFPYKTLKSDGGERRYRFFKLLKKILKLFNAIHLKFAGQTVALVNRQFWTAEMPVSGPSLIPISQAQKKTLLDGARSFLSGENEEGGVAS